jgi:ankyrin repeat protein
LNSNEKLIEGVRNSHLPQVQEALAEGADVNTIDKDGNSPLHWAVRGFKKITRALINAGANVNQADNDGKVPLDYAVRMGYEAMVRILINAGANVNQGDNNGKFPLHWAAAAYQSRIARILVEAGADVSRKDKDGNTPLNAAQEGMRKLLITSAKVRGMWSLWELEQPDYTSYLQWLPREVLDDQIALGVTKESKTMEF